MTKLFSKQTVGTIAAGLREIADKQGIPLRTLADVQDTIAQCRKQKSDKAMARIMLNHGRLADDARAWLAKEYPQ